MLLLLRHDKVSEQPLLRSRCRWHAEMVGCTALSERIPVLRTMTGLRPPPATAPQQADTLTPARYPGQVA